ncbi:hypothetical protein LTT66_18240 [Nocardia gipuzkoensis]|uniref:hypothetical protein n=1 Tax=Nocardia gipuzkoensis TaxID=2749991 RepID=UPI001E47B3C7|nr:hypothetical protein [Nocardia gipuzkoensis]UGT65310.1 hypothetical protein LTT66_18240 [Nocardia gipuzkoensis]
MPDLANLVTMDPKRRKLLIDGREFPWLINEDGVTLNNLPPSSKLASVTLTFFPRDVEVDQAEKKLIVDGEEFPWLINENGPTVSNLDVPDELTSVTLTFYARDVEVIPRNAEESAEKPQVA